MICFNRVLKLIFVISIAICFLSGNSFAIISLGKNYYRYKKVLPREELADGRIINSDKLKNSPLGSAGEFMNKYGGNWSFTWDKITLTPLLVSGEGIPILAEGMSLADVERASREFVDENRSLFGIGSENLILNIAATKNAGPYGEMWFVHFDQIYNGIPVLNSNIFFRYKFGRLIQFGSKSFPNISLNSSALLSQENALKKAMKEIAFNKSSDRVEYAGELFVYPVLVQGGYVFNPVFKNIFLKSDPYGEWVVYVNASDGSIVEKYSNTYFFEGRLISYIHPRGATDSYVDVPMSNILVNIAGIKNVLTDYAGIFGARMMGVSSVSMNVGGPGAIARQCNTVFIGGGDDYARCNSVATKVVFMGNSNWNSEDSVLFVLDDSNTTSAERDAYYNINNAINWAGRYIKSDWFSKELSINVNIREMVEMGPFGEKRESAACNAFWDGKTINLFDGGEEGEGNEKVACNNTANIADIALHEWGHGLDQNTGGIDDPSFSEGIGDIVSFLLTGDPYIAPTFYVNPPAGSDGTYIREVSTDRIYPRDKNKDPHIEGLIIASTWWDLRSYLVQKYGAQGNDIVSYLFLNQLLTAKEYTDSYAATLAVDDDDGNMANGTPNKDIILRAFREHGLAKN